MKAVISCLTLSLILPLGASAKSWNENSQLTTERVSFEEAMQSDKDRALCSMVVGKNSKSITIDGKMLIALTDEDEKDLLQSLNVKSYTEIPRDQQGLYSYKMVKAVRDRAEKLCGSAKYVMYSGYETEWLQQSGSGVTFALGLKSSKVSATGRLVFKSVTCTTLTNATPCVGKRY